MAHQLARELGLPKLYCRQATTNAATSHAVHWDKFPSGDPNLKLLVDAVKDKHVVFLFSSDEELLYEQLALILFLRRFTEPRPLQGYADNKWKDSITNGEYDVRSVSSLTVVIPWFRHCQMERTCRWTLREGKWTNRAADGPFLDVPTAQISAAILSCRPAAAPRGRPMPPQHLLFIDLHEYDVIDTVLSESGCWSNPPRPYDLIDGSGTYFVSAFHHFLKHTFLPANSQDAMRGFVVFPDFGAHRRFCAMVRHACHLPLDHILWIDKARDGTEIEQTDAFHYVDECGAHTMRIEPFPGRAHILIADDFTNSGGTLFGGAAIIRKHCAGASVRVSAYVTHFVCKYSLETVRSFLAKLHSPQPVLDSFFCTDSVAASASWLETEEAALVADGQPLKVNVMPIAPVIATWIRENPPPALRKPSRRTSFSAAASGGWRSAELLLVGAAAGFALARVWAKAKLRGVAA